MNAGPHVLVIGSGSAGKRHARNLASLGCRISVVDPREDRRQEIAREISLAASFQSVEEGLGAASYGGAVISSPPHAHVDQAIAMLDADVPVLLEKPVSPDAASATRLASHVEKVGVPILLGYTWRWWPPLRAVRELLREGAIGRLLHVRCSLSAHLADWHPWERYQDYFMSRAAEGGGALLDESHWIDLMLWFFGTPVRVFARIDRLSELEIDVDDNVDMLLDFVDGPRVMLHLDLYGRPHERFVQFVGEEGTLYWSDSPNGYRIGRGPSSDWEETTFACERNDMFIAVAAEFLEVIGGKRLPSCTVADGVRVLTVIEAARISQQNGCSTELRTGGAP